MQMLICTTIKQKLTLIFFIFYSFFLNMTISIENFRLNWMDNKKNLLIVLNNKLVYIKTNKKWHRIKKLCHGMGIE